MSNDQLLDKMEQIMDTKLEKMSQKMDDKIKANNEQLLKYMNKEFNNVHNEIASFREEVKGEFVIVKNNMTQLIKRQNHFGEELAKTYKNLDEINKELDETRQELTETRQGLEKTNIDLANTNKELANTNKLLEEHIKQNKVEHKKFEYKIENIEWQAKIVN